MWFALRREDMGFIDRARAVHRVEATLAAPRDRVFAAFADPAGWPAWFPNVQAAAYLTPPPHGVGTIREARVAGTRWREEMIAWDDGVRWAWTVLQATVPLASAQVESFAFADAPGGGTRVEWTLALEPRLVARLGARFTPATLARMLERATAALDARLAQAPATVAP
jgi:uncharacterized protein YndB with AHSA1/START domain